MDATDFSHKLAAFQHHFRLFYQQLANRSAPLEVPHHDTLAGLQGALDELQVADDTLREQHEQLAAAYYTIAADRQRYRALFERAPDGHLLTTMAGTITEANRLAADLLAMRQDQLVGKPLAVFVPREARPAFWSQLAAAAQESRRFQHWELWLQPWRRKPFYAALSVAPLHDSDGVLRGLQWSIRDITMRQQAVMALQTSEAHFRALANAVPAIVWTAAPDGTMTFANDQWFHFCGLTPEQNAQHWSQLVLHPDDQERCIAQWSEALAHGTTYEIEVRNRRYDGVYRWFLTRAVPVRDHADRITAWFGTTTDIHDRKLLEERLQQSEERLQLALSTASAAYWEWDLQTNTTTWSAEGACLLGLASGQEPLSYEAWRQRIYPDDVERIEKARAQAIAQRTAVEAEYRVVWPDGSVHWLQSRGQVMVGPQNRPLRVLGLTMDITARKRAEGARRASEERLRLALQAARMVAWDWDPHTDDIVYSETAAEVFGLLPEVSLDKREQSVALIHPGDLAQHQQTVYDAMARGTGYVSQFWFIRPRDGDLIWLEDHGRAVCDTTGKVLHLSGVVVDITERKRTEKTLQSFTDTLAQQVAERTAELSQANATLQAEMHQHRRAREQLEHHQAALAHREKLAAMGSLLASVAHELNNPLSVVMMQADLLREVAADSPLEMHITELTQAAKQCGEIVQHFLSLVRQQPPQRTQVALNAVVEAAMKLLAYPLQVDNISVKYLLADHLPVLWADPHQLQQVVVNLITNAHQALREVAGPRQLTITTRVEHTPQRVILEVADTGPGIPAAIRQRIFDPFFTTRPPGVGTGLGLPLCLGIVEGHGGTLRVDSEPGHGTVFGVELPLGSVPVDVPAPEPVALPAATPKTILVVDDEPRIVRALTSLLQRDGHTVETAANGRLALEKCQSQDYDHILCDLRMPELDGPGFYQELQHHCPHLCARLVFLTGDTLSPEIQTFLEDAGVPRLNKPFTAAIVRKAIQGL